MFSKLSRKRHELPRPSGGGHAGRGATSPRPLIVGGNFGGKGAEAMLITVRDAILRRFPHAACCVPISAESGREEFAAHGLVPVLRRQKTRGVARLERWLTVNVGIRPSPVDPVKLHAERRAVVNPYRCSDAVIDISGFTGSDEFGPKAAFYRFQAYEHAAATGNRIILMPQSWGPFKNPVVRDYVARLVRISDLVFARERESLAYLGELPGVDPARIVLAADIALQFRSDPPDAGRTLLAQIGLPHGSRPLLGITPNMRIVERTPGEGSANAYFRDLFGLCRWFLDNTAVGLVLIPHEYTPGRANDPELCAALAVALKSPDRVACLTGRESAAAIKSIIGLLDFVVASRYHSLVAAVSMRTPVAVIGWSHKYDELMELAGLRDWALDPARRPAAAAQELVFDAWNRRDEIRATLHKHVPALEDSSKGALERMVTELGRA